MHAYCVLRWVLPVTPTAATAELLREGGKSNLHTCDPARSNTCVRTGSKLMSCATPGMPISEMAWSMPPDCVPTYRSQVHANSATSWGARRKHRCQGHCSAPLPLVQHLTSSIEKC